MNETRTPEDGNAEIVSGGHSLTSRGLRRLTESVKQEVTLECAEDEDGNPVCSISMEDWARAKASPEGVSLRLVVKVALKESKPSGDASGPLSDPSLFERQTADGTDDEA